MTDWLHISYIIISVLAGLMALFVAGYVYRRRSTQGGVYFALFMLAVAIWSIGNTAEFLSPSIPAKLQWGKITFLGIVSVAPLWLLFAVRFAHPSALWTISQHIMLWLPAVVVELMVLTNHLHGLVWSEVVVLQTEPHLLIRFEYNIVLWLANTYFYILLLVGTVVLIRAVLRSSQLFRSQVAVLLVAIFLPWIANFLFITGLISWDDQDLTPIAFSLTGVLVALGLFRYRFLDILPIARGLVIEGMKDGMIVLDEHNRIVDLNPAAATLLGCRQQDVVGQAAEKVLTRWSVLVERFRDVTETKSEILINRLMWFDLHITPLLDHKNRAMGRVIVLRNITSRKHIEAELQRYTAELEAGNAELDAFAHTVAHDLRSPLSLMTGFATILREEFEHLSPEEIREYLDHISAAGTKMDSIISALLQLASIRRSEEVPVETLDMAAIVEEVQRRHAPLTGERQAMVRTMGDWPLVRGVGAWVEIVWTNYVSNALKYGGSNAEGVEQHVEMGWESDPSTASDKKRHVRFYVLDNGRGLSEEQCAKLFTPFTRLHLNEPEGHGLGLTIVERIITRLGGSVGVESRIGEGSRFWFTLPEVNSTVSLEN